MLEAVGHPHAVNPDRQLRRAAEARGWPVLDFATRAGQTCEQQLQ
jgi:phosphoserine phosphatase